MEMALADGRGQSGCPTVGTTCVTGLLAVLAAGAVLAGRRLLVLNRPALLAALQAHAPGTSVSEMPHRGRTRDTLPGTVTPKETR